MDICTYICKQEIIRKHMRIFQDSTMCVFIFWAWIIHGICEPCFSLNKPQFHITETQVFPYSKYGGT